MNMKEERDKVALKLNIQNAKIMSSIPITSLQIEGATMEKVTDFFFFFEGGSKITACGDFSYAIKRCFLLERKAMTNLDNILKRREITLPTKVHIVKAVVCPVVVYGCDTGTVKRKLSAEELMLLNCGAGEDSGESRGLQRDQTSQS